MDGAVFSGANLSMGSCFEKQFKSQSGYLLVDTRTAASDKLLESAGYWDSDRQSQTPQHHSDFQSRPRKCNGF